jgi:hypothetical protein
MEYSLLVQIQGKTLKDVIVGVDCVAANLERDKLIADGAAPDKSGQYNFICVKDDDILDFGNIETKKEIKEKLDKKDEEIETLNGIIEDLKNKVSVEEKEADLAMEKLAVARKKVEENQKNGRRNRGPSLY